jgi:hypothetical protein
MAKMSRKQSGPANGGTARFSINYQQIGFAIGTAGSKANCTHRGNAGAGIALKNP